ncbi:MAG: hypothetical protein JXA93_02915 [Anaerolineae bacterium]|nr:hypothetical protein [Anaerolineae bacterium]
MAKGNGNRDRVTQWMRWIARIWSLPLMSCALLVLVGYGWSWLTTGVADPYAVEDYALTEALPPIFMLLSSVGLGIAWRWERLGGTIAVVFQLAALPLLFIHSPLTRDFPRMVVPYLLSMIVTIPGVLFLVCWWRSR